MEVHRLVVDLMIVLIAGFVVGVICKRIGISLLVGYLVVGALIGGGGLGWVSQAHHELEYLARAGALLLLFSVGIEFSLGELVRLSRYLTIGGAVQMLLVAVPLVVVCMIFGMGWKAALLAGSAGALSSTILVFKALAEWGQTESPHGRRAIGILLFQDIALVPLMLLIPLLIGTGPAPTISAYAVLAGKSFAFLAAVIGARVAIARWMVPLLAGSRSVELIVLFALGLLCGVCWGAYMLGLPAALGALAAGLMLSDNRLSKQIDTLVLPYRESFAAVFFVTLGTLLQPKIFLDEPLLLTGGLIGMLVLKSLAAGIALRLVGLSWKASIGMGLGLAQLGEFAFLLIAEGVSHGLIDRADYNRMLFVALGTLILTPQLLKLGLRWTDDSWVTADNNHSAHRSDPVQRALVIGIGPIGRQVASRLETLGIETSVIDFSPVNLYSFAQMGFHAVAGDARDAEVLQRADARHCRLGIVCVPDDEAATQIVAALRETNAAMSIIVRCRFMSTIALARKAGADAVVSEEAEASDALLQLCESVVSTAPTAKTPPPSAAKN